MIVACGFDHAGYVLRDRLLGVIRDAGHGAGVSVAAGKIDGVRAATIHDTYTAHQGVEHDAVNVLCLGGRVVGVEVAAEIVQAFLAAVISSEERHVRRRAKVEEIERTQGDLPDGF